MSMLVLFIANQTINPVIILLLITIEKKKSSDVKVDRLPFQVKTFA